MSVMRWALALGLIAGCGRFGFDPLRGDTGSDSDDGTDPSDSGVGVGSDAGGSDSPQSSSHYIAGGSTSQSAPVTSISTTTTPLLGSNMLLVVAVHWGNTTASVSTVQDTNGNGFSMAGSMTRYNSAQSQIIWFKKVTAGTTINVYFTAPTGTVDLKWAAYRDIDQTSPIGATIGRGGTGTTADTGVLSFNRHSILVASSGSLAFGAAAGTGYTQRHNSGGGVLEDLELDPGIANATATLSSSTDWIIQVVALHTL